MTTQLAQLKVAKSQGIKVKQFSDFALRIHLLFVIDLTIDRLVRFQ